MPGLNSLRMLNLRSVKNLDPVRAVTKLGRLELGGCRVDPVPTVLQCAHLERLAFSGGSLRRELSRLEPILPQLVTFDVEGGFVGDLAPLARLTRARSVALENLTITDVSPLARLPGIQDICLFGSELDISPLALLPRRVTIRLLRGQEVKGLDAVRGRHRIVHT